MTLLTILLLIILFLTFFIYFSGLNPQEVTIFLMPDQEFTATAAVLVVGCVAIGLAFGLLATIFHTLTHQFKHLKRGREEKRSREVANLYREGSGRLLSGDPKKAHTLLQKALDRDASRIETYLALASVHVAEGTPQEGVALLLKARDLEPQSLEVLFKLGSVYLETDQTEEAARTFTDILAIDNNNRKALRSLRDLHIKQGNWHDASELQKRVLKAAQGSPRLPEEKQLSLHLRYQVAQQALETGEGEKALGELKEIIKTAPDFTPARVTLGDALKAAGRKDEASRAWQDGYLQGRNGVFLARLEELSLETEDPTALLSFYRSSLTQNPDDMMLRLFFGKFCLRLEMVDEALEQLFAVENAGVDTPQLHLLLAEAHRRRERTEEAIAAYQKALGVEAQLSLAYTCEQCGDKAPSWQSRCRSCSSWGSYTLEGRRMLQEARPIEAREIYHGARSA